MSKWSSLALVKTPGIDTDDDCVSAYERLRAIVEVLDEIKDKPVGPVRAEFIAKEGIRVTELLEALYSEAGTLLSLYRQRFESASDLDE